MATSRNSTPCAKAPWDSDGVIHLAFSHDFSQFEKNAADERKAIAALGEVLLGSDRPFVVTSGTGVGRQCGRQAIDGGWPNVFVEPSRRLGNDGKGVHGTRRENFHRPAGADS